MARGHFYSHANDPQWALQLAIESLCIVAKNLKYIVKDVGAVFLKGSGNKRKLVTLRFNARQITFYLVNG